MPKPNEPIDINSYLTDNSDSEVVVALINWTNGEVIYTTLNPSFVGNTVQSGYKSNRGLSVGEKKSTSPFGDLGKDAFLDPTKT